jgi:hypothetical protein
MEIDAATLKWIVGGTLAAVASSIVATLKAGRMSKDAEKVRDDNADLTEAVFGNNRKHPPVVGLKSEVAQLRKEHDREVAKTRGIQRGLNAPGSQEHEIAERVRASLAAADESETTGQHAALQRQSSYHRALSGWSEQMPPPPPQVTHRPTPYGLKREEPESDQPPPRRRRDGGE